MKKIIYPGSFDPLTYGHLDVIHRAAKLFDNVIVAVARNDDKKSLFTPQERVELIKKSIGTTPNIEVTSFDGLLVDYVQTQNAHTVLRGLRAISDFEFEFQMALSNRKIQPDIETLFLMPKAEYSYISSRIVKAIAELHGDVSAFVPPASAKALQEKFKR